MSQQAQMNVAGMGGPVGGGAAGAQMNAGTPGGNMPDLTPKMMQIKLNTAIYDYLLRNSLYDIAKSFQKDMTIETKQDIKQSPNQRNGQMANGIDGMDDMKDPGLMKKPDDLPLPNNMYDGPFLQDWWFQFWEIYMGNRNRSRGNTQQYVTNQRQNQKTRMQLMGGMDPNSMQNLRGYNNMMQGMNNGMGMGPNDLKRTAMQQNQQRNLYVSGLRITCVSRLLGSLLMSDTGHHNKYNI